MKKSKMANQSLESAINKLSLKNKGSQRFSLKVSSANASVSLAKISLLELHNLHEERMKRKRSLSNTSLRHLPVFTIGIPQAVIQQKNNDANCPADQLGKIKEIESKWQLLKPKLVNRSIVNTSSSKIYSSGLQSTQASQNINPNACSLNICQTTRHNALPAKIFQPSDNDEVELGIDLDESIGSTQINQLKAFEDLLTGKTPSHRLKSTKIMDNSPENIEEQDCRPAEKHNIILTKEGKPGLPNTTSLGAVNSRKGFQNEGANLFEKIAKNISSIPCEVNRISQLIGRNQETVETKLTHSEQKTAGRPRSLSKWNCPNKAKLRINPSETNKAAKECNSVRNSNNLSTKNQVAKKSRRLDMKKMSDCPAYSKQTSLCTSTQRVLANINRSQKIPEPNLASSVRSHGKKWEKENDEKATNSHEMRNKNFSTLLSKAKTISHATKKSTSKKEVEKNFNTAGLWKKNQIEDIEEETEELDESKQLFDSENILQNSKKMKECLKSKFPVKNIDDAFNKLYEAALMRQMASMQFEKAKTEIIAQLKGKPKPEQESRNAGTQHLVKGRPESCAKLRSSVTKVIRVMKDNKPKGKRSTSAIKSKITNP